MTNTTITVPTVSARRPEGRDLRRPVRTAAIAVAGAAAAFVLGWGVASATNDTEPAVVVPTATVVAPARPAMSPDAMTRWAEHADAPSITSADAAERHALAEAER